jgi:hypothetical protein
MQDPKAEYLLKFCGHCYGFDLVCPIQDSYWNVIVTVAMLKFG